MKTTTRKSWSLAVTTTASRRTTVSSISEYQDQDHVIFKTFRWVAINFCATRFSTLSIFYTRGIHQHLVTFVTCNCCAVSLLGTLDQSLDTLGLLDTLESLLGVLEVDGAGDELLDLDLTTLQELDRHLVVTL